MARRSPASPMLCEKYKSGCALGLINICQVYSNKKLIPDRKHLNRNTVGNLNTRKGPTFLSHSDDDCKCIDDRKVNKTLSVGSGKTKTVKLMEEDMSSKLQIKKIMTSADIENTHYTSEFVGQLPKKHRMSSKTCPRPASNDVRDAEGHIKHEFVTKTEVYCNQVHLKNGKSDDRIQKRNNSINHHNPAQSNDADEAYVNQNLIDGKYLIGGEFSHQSKQFLDALEILSSNKEIFVKLLQDPSSLLVKHIQDLRVCQEKCQQTKSFSQTKLSDARECEKPICTQNLKKRHMHSAFMKKIMFRNGNLFKGSNYRQDFNEIVVLKSGLTGMQNCGNRNSHCSILQPCVGKEGQGVRPPSFSFGGIKRKLGHAIGVSKKLERQIPIDGKSCRPTGHHLTSEDGDEGVVTEFLGRKFPCKICFDTDELSTSSIDLNMSDKIGRTKDFELSIGPVAPSSSVKHHKRTESNIYSGARSQLNEMLSNGNGGQGLSRKELSKGWERTLYLPQFNLSNALEKERQSSLLTSTMGKDIEAQSQACNASDHLEIYESKQNKSDNPSPDTEVLQSVCFPPDSLSAKGSSKQYGKYYTLTNANACEENEYLECLRPVSPLKNKATGSPLDFSLSSHLSIERVGDSSSRQDTTEHPSPVSVLDQFLIEDDSSPSNAQSRPAEPPEQSLRINCQQHSSDPKINLSIYEHESTSTYVREALQTANLNWDELSVKCHAYDQSGHDSRLLIDLLNEIILEVYNSYVTYPPWLSFIKPNIRPVSLEKNVAHEVVKCIDGHLLHQPLPQSMKHIVEKDLARSSTWMDIRNDSENIVTEMVESILDELVIESTI